MKDHFKTATLRPRKADSDCPDGRDIVGKSKQVLVNTYLLLPIFQKLDTTVNGVQAVITVSQCELATQIYNAQITAFTKFDENIRISNFVGGTDKTSD